MVDRAAYRNLVRPQTRRPEHVEPVLKPFRDDWWTQADGYRVVDARANGRCECSPECTDRAEIHHHIAGRKVDDPHRPSNLLAMSDRHHRYAHAHPREAYQRGWMRSRLAVEP